jgi:hypothetical protein
MMGCESWARRERGTCTRDSETGSREMVTCMEWANAAMVMDRKGKGRVCSVWNSWSHMY